MDFAFSRAKLHRAKKKTREIKFPTAATLQFWPGMLLTDQPPLVRRHHPTSTSRCHPLVAAPASGLLRWVRTCSGAGQQPQSCAGRASCQAGRQAGRQLSKHCPVRVAAAASWKKRANGSLFFVTKHSYRGGNKRPECVFNALLIDFTENTDASRWRPRWCQRRARCLSE